MAAMTEIETKFSAPVDFTMPDLTVVPGVASVDEPTEFDLDATYYDTADLALARRRMTLRRRRGGHDAGWHLKRPAGMDRSELQVPATESRKVPDEITSQIWVHSRGSTLAPVVRIRTHRAERALRAADGKVLALVADDAVNSMAYGVDPPPKQQWHELEAELVNGDRALLDAVGQALRQAGAEPAAAPSKFAHALNGRLPSPTPSEDGATGESPTKGGTGPGIGPGSRAIAEYLRAQRDAILRNDPLVRSGDPDGVHDMRVAIRRIRATMRTYRAGLDPERTAPLRDELQWLGLMLGALRDAHVLTERFEAAVAAEPPEVMIGPVASRIRERLAASQGEASAALRSAMTSRRYARILNALDDYVGSVAPDATDERLRRSARKAVTRADAMLDAAQQLPLHAAGVPEPSSGPRDQDAGLHEARKAYKRARYAAEALAPVGGSSATQLAKRMRTLQDLLGAHQDTVVGARLMRDYGMRAHLDGDNAFSYGLLYQREVEEGRRWLDGLDRARRRAGKRSVRAWLR